MIKKLVLLGTILCGLTFLTACSSVTHGSNAGGGYSYGTGPNKTKPYPQTTKVNIQGVGGAKPIYEKQRSNGCNKDYTVLGKNYMVWRGCNSYIEEGVASWYGPGFNGKKTSNGEVYNQKGYTAAHKNLPLPSYLKVTNLTNGKKVIVRVNDRGPFVGTRIIDLSEGSARAIGMIGAGTAKVRIELINVNSNGTYANAYGMPSGYNISPSNNYFSNNTSSSKTTSKIKNIVNNSKVNSIFKSASKGSNYIQLVACNSDLLAAEIKKEASTKTKYPVIIAKDGNVNRVLVGPLSDSAARGALQTLKAKGYTDCFIKKF